MRPKIQEEMIKVVLVGRLFEGGRWVQLKIFGQGGTTELETLSLSVVKGDLLDVQY